MADPEKSSVGPVLSNSIATRSARKCYRRHPLSVAVDPVSLIVSECLAITSALQRYARTPQQTVSTILGGGSSTLILDRPGRPSGARRKSPFSKQHPRDRSLTGRWNLKGEPIKSSLDGILMHGFTKLREELVAINDIHIFDALSLLSPFLQVIQTKGTAATISMLCLGAIRKFIAYGFISTESPQFVHALQSMATAVTHCQFDSSDSGQVEAVLLMILNLMEDILLGVGGDLLSDGSVCDLLGRGLAICSEPRLSPVLRRTAEATMLRMCQIIFEDLKFMETERENGALGFREVTTQYEKGAQALLPPSGNGIVPEIILSETTNIMTQAQEGEIDATSSSSNVDDLSDGPEDSGTLDLAPYSVQSIEELLRVLVNFLDSYDRQNSDSMRIVALHMINAALEISGSAFADHPSLSTIVAEKLCGNLFQLIRSDNVTILQESLAVSCTLLVTCRGFLKLQQELHLSYIIASLHSAAQIPRESDIDPSLYSGIPLAPKLLKSGASFVSSGRSTPVPTKDRQKLGLDSAIRKADARQAMVESLGLLARIPSFMLELFVNYDCDENRADLCEDLIGLLCRNALPDSAIWSTTSVPPLCLDAILRFIQHIYSRLDREFPSSNFSDAADLREIRRRKKIIITATNRFNENPVEGLAYLDTQGLVDAQSPASVAAFLRATSRISKKSLGEYLSKKGNESILDAYMETFDFADKRVDEALRILLETFRLPGESPLIERIVNSFSAKYSANGNHNTWVADKDAVFILTYAIIMLNTDQHNPNLKSQKRMTLADFARNLRGQNGGANFASEYLEDIFDSIRKHEIILPDEHDNKHGFNYTWKELLLKAKAAGRFISCDTNLYDPDLFSITWRPIISTLCYIFMSATDDAVFTRIVAGFHECARIAIKFEDSEALDHIIYSLGVMTTLSNGTRFNTALNTEVPVGDRSVVVSQLAVKLGRDLRAQLAVLVLFRVVSGGEELIQTGWKHIVPIWLNLFNNSLIPASFLGAKLPISDIPLQSSSLVIDRAAKIAESGFFSAFTSYISNYAADEPLEPSDEELESSLCSVDCIQSCKLLEIFAKVLRLSSTQCTIIVDALLAQLPGESSVVADFSDSEALVNLESDQIVRPLAPEYDPSVIFILEFCTVLSCRDPNMIQTLAKPVVDSLQNTLRDAAKFHPIIVSRAMFYILKLLHASYVHDFINVPVILHLICTLSQEYQWKSWRTVLPGLLLCIEPRSSLRGEMMTSPDFWAILRLYAADTDSAPSVFIILEKGIHDTPPSILADNYEAAISLLSSFAAAASSPVGPSLATYSHPAKKKLQGEKSTEDLVSRAICAVSLLCDMTSRIPELIERSHLTRSEAWSAYWLPVFQAFTTHCTNPYREIRQAAFKSLHQCLLSPQITSGDTDEWIAIFDKVLFPLIFGLLKPELFLSDRDGISEMRIQVASLLCKVFLQYLQPLSSWGGLLDLWIKIIEIMDRLMNSGQGDTLEEAVRENLKNVLHIMVSSDLFAPGRNSFSDDFWEETWKLIDRFLPQLRTELSREIR